MTTERRIDRTNAERQRRYRARLKSQSELAEWYEKDNVRLRKRLEELKRQLRGAKKESP